MTKNPQKTANHIEKPSTISENHRKPKKRRKTVIKLREILEKLTKVSNNHRKC